jgi:hypothetical protein
MIKQNQSQYIREIHSCLWTKISWYTYPRKQRKGNINWQKWVLELKQRLPQIFLHNNTKLTDRSWHYTNNKDESCHQYESIEQNHIDLPRMEKKIMNPADIWTTLRLPTRVKAKRPAFSLYTVKLESILKLLHLNV